MPRSEVSGGEEVACTNTKFAAKPTDGAVAYWHCHRQCGGEAHAAGAAHAHAAASSSSCPRHVSLPTYPRGTAAAGWADRTAAWTRPSRRCLTEWWSLGGTHTAGRKPARTAQPHPLAFWVRPPAQAIERLRPSPHRPILCQPSPPPVSCAGWGRSPQPQRSDSHRSKRPRATAPNRARRTARISSLLAAERARGPTYLLHCHARRIAWLCSEGALAPRLHRRLLLRLPLWPPRRWP
jgi:hypothetical protein